MMDQLYDLGITCIEFIQYWFGDYAHFFEVVNDLSNPNHAYTYLFPLMSVIDSVFAAQLLLCISFGGWLNSVMKWWLLEDRPYWWVRDTDFYRESDRPQLRLTPQTCETGPGCPSGHSASVATLMLLTIMWLQHVMNDRKFYIWWWKYIFYPLTGVAVLSVMFARMFIATHFPHQTVLGAFIGSFLAPGLCIYVSDPFIWQYGVHKYWKVNRAIMWHVVCAILAIAISFVTYFSLKVCGMDPLWTIKLAFRWCPNYEHVHVSTTPMFALVHSTGSLLGWALFVSPDIAKYRHYTRSRSVIISLFCTAGIVYSINKMQAEIDRDHAVMFYFSHFIIAAVTPALFLRVVPLISMWPFSGKEKVE